MKTFFKRILMTAGLALCLAVPATALSADQAPEKQPAAASADQPAEILTGADTLEALGVSLCGAGLKADADALLNLFEPVHFQMQLDMIREFTAQAAQETGETPQDPREMIRKEFTTGMQENPLVECKIVSAETSECPEQILQSYVQLQLTPQACGTLTMQSKMAKDEQAPPAESVPALKMNDRWFLAIFM